jgi:hypothetical protein
MSTNLSPNLAGVLYLEIVFKKLYLLYIGMEGVINNSVDDYDVIKNGPANDVNTVF